MAGFGNGSDGALNVASGTTNLNLNQKYQFTSINIAAGATLSTNSTTGAVLYLLCQGTCTIDGVINVSGKVNRGNNTWGVTLDGDTYNSPGVAAGGDGGSLTTETGDGGTASAGFGGGGGGNGGTTGHGNNNGGDGGDGSATFGSPGAQRTATRTSAGTTNSSGNNATGSAGGGGGAIVNINSLSGGGSVTLTARGGAGGSSYGDSGDDGSRSGSYSGVSFSYLFSGGGGGGAGGQAGRAGVHVVIKADTIILNGEIITSGTQGGAGGNGGRRVVNSGSWSSGSQPPFGYLAHGGSGGGGGGGGNGGNILLQYATSYANAGSYALGGATGGSRGQVHNGTTWVSDSSAVAGTAGSNGSFTAERPEIDFESGISGTLLLSGTVDRPMWEAGSSITGTLLLSGSLNAFKQNIPTEVERKTFSYKVYDDMDNFLGEWTDVISELGFSQEINTAGSAVEVELARNSDSISVDIESLLDESSSEIDDNNSLPIQTTVISRNQVGPGSNVNHNYRVDIFAYYGRTDPILDSDSNPILDSDDQPIIGTTGAPNGVRRFTGFISDIATRYGDTETTKVTLMSFGFDLDQYVVEDSSDTTVPFNSYDPSDIVREGLDQFVSRGGITTYTSATIDDTSTVVSYTFRLNTFLELLKKSLELAPEGWFFYVDLGTNNTIFKNKPASPQHIFTLGIEIKSLDLRSYIEDVVNDVYFVGGEVGMPLEPLYIRTTEAPASFTRRGLRRITDNRVTLTASAEVLSEGEIDRNNRIQYRSTITILDKVYDIESIKLGDVIGFRNFDNYVDTLTMQVVKITYNPDFVVLTLDTLLPNVNKRLEDIRRNLNQQENLGIPDAPS